VLCRLVLTQMFKRLKVIHDVLFMVPGEGGLVFLAWCWVSAPHGGGNSSRSPGIAQHFIAASMRDLHMTKLGST
jgi:hypothetical protein